EDGVGAEAVGELADVLDRFVPSLADDVRGAELLSQRDAVWVTAKEDDLLGAEAFGRDDAAQPDGPVTDDGDGLSGAGLGCEGRVVAGSHHIREREKRRDQRVVRADWKGYERPVGQGNTHRLALAAVDAVPRPEAA